MTYDSISRAKMIKTGSNVIGNSALMEDKHMSDFPGLFECNSDEAPMNG